MVAETSSPNTGENSRARLELLLDAEKLSRLLLDQLKHGAESRLYGIGDERLVASVILRCLAFRRSLLENKPGPKNVGGETAPRNRGTSLPDYWETTRDYWLRL